MGLKKREKRVRGVAEDFQQKWDKAREEKRIMEQPDTDFFYIDKSPAKKKLDRVERKRRLYGDSVGIESAPSKYQDLQLEKMAKKLKSEPAPKKVKKTKPTNSLYDMWDTSEETKKPVPKPAKMPLVPVAHPGQSYHPVFDDHQSVLKKAVEVEVKRDEAFDKARESIFKGMSEATKSLLVDPEKESESEEEGNDDSQTGNIKIKKKGKLTRAERNRIRRRKIAEHEALMAAQKKKIIKGIDTARQLAKALDKKKGGAVKKATKEPKKRKQEIVLEREADPKKARSVEVSLSDELHGSLRLLKSKGDIIIDAVDAIQKRGQYEKIPINRKGSSRPQAKYKFFDRYRD